ncbi:MAG: GNAT family N-acetyltransferase [Chloroflexota bacterium]
MTFVDQQTGKQTSIPAHNYSFDQLADIYNRARVDYIVPMPMNGKRMADYVRHYDIDLDASAIALTNNKTELGVIMTGIRGKRSWATRLGVIPEQRGHKIGQFLMELVIEKSRERHIRHVQLEVIKGNEPAYCLFIKLGFQEVRELLVIRRPPGRLRDTLAPVGAVVTPLVDEDIPSYLLQRDPAVAWTEETESLLHVGKLKGLHAKLPSGESGWAIFQCLPFQLTHFVLSPSASSDLAQALLYAIHTQYPMQDTKIENFPAQHPTWPVYQKLGYLESFRRIEMVLELAPDPKRGQNISQPLRHAI